jgi:phenylpropionate dioxygenase-like ring-hydroxylating dioxygenase large terminal subunit
VLSTTENDILVGVGPGTPMGELFRQYWLPVLLADELFDADGPPLRVRLLGEDLVAFRDTHGVVGLLAEACPHRGASTYYGRNEQGGLRCVYHGWKFDVTGRCLDMPSEPEESNFKDKVRQTAYPCVDRNGVIWTYMGPRSEPPPFPEYEFATVPAENSVSATITEACNWLQILEGDLDSAHLDFLHNQLTDEEIASGMLPIESKKDRTPRIEVAQTEYGLTKGARRTVDGDNYYWRVYQYMLPAVVLLPSTGDTIMFRITVPIDDGHTTFWNGAYSPSRPLTESERERHQRSRAIGGYQTPNADPRSRWRPVANRDNDYLLDREAQATRRFSGIPPVKLQDVAMTESMGPVNNRTKEHLGTTDTAIIQMRRSMLRAATALRDSGTTPPGVDDPSIFRVRSATAVLPKSANWLSEIQSQLMADPRQPVLSVPRPPNA